MASVLEQIAQNVLATLQNVTTANGYAYSLTVTRALAKSVPSHLTAEIFQVPGDVADDPPIGTEELDQMFAVVVYVLPAESDTTPVDGYVNELSAALHTELMRDFTRGGLAVDTRIMPLINFPPVQGEYGGCTFNFSVKYRTALDKPFVPAT